MNDPLADLIAEMTEALDNWHPFPPADWGEEVKWLRANRERVLRALGGLYLDTEDVWWFSQESE